MPDESTIPLRDVLRAANELVAAGLIEDYALGGALAAIYYVEPFTTYDADIMFVAAEKGGRHKDFARIEQFLEQVEIDRTLLDDILRRYKLKLPKP